MEHEGYVEITIDLVGDSSVLIIDEKNSQVKSPKLDNLSESSFARNVSTSSLKPSLRFLDGVPWKSVKESFRESAVDGVLAKDKFGVVIGMEDSEEFAMEIYNVFAKRLRLNTSNGIEMEVMYEIWSLMNSQDFEVQLQLFFDFCDKNGDGKLSEEEIREAIELSASTNKLFSGSTNKLKTEAADYARLIMNELDPDDLGFIEASVDIIIQNEIPICNRHPFYIVSAPDDDYISVLINTSKGEWTAALQENFAMDTTLWINHLWKSGFIVNDSVIYEMQASESLVNREIGNARVVSDSDESNLQPKISIPYLIMKGPYGIPPQDYKKYDIVLLIGFGLGATLNFSILQDLLNNLQESRAQDIERKKVPYKAYFYWVTSNQISFDVFKGVFDKTAEYDSDNVIEMNNYLTSVYEEGDARSALIQIVQSLQHAKDGLDVISRTWVFQLLHLQHT
uniref:EF-hand domain-containing protein n=1 Tax=Chenopodium quinoa TaxID=63459 RepID=A0A803LCR9_CHEQI